jgi:hypothetical protein
MAPGKIRIFLAQVGAEVMMFQEFDARCDVYSFGIGNLCVLLG